MDGGHQRYWVQRRVYLRVCVGSIARACVCVQICGGSSSNSSSSEGKAAEAVEKEEEAVEEEVADALVDVVAPRSRRDNSEETGAVRF
ncbi:unnamed protein product [Lampetra planeri]